jgi:hypothetical protein
MVGYAALPEFNYLPTQVVYLTLLRIEARLITNHRPFQPLDNRRPDRATQTPHHHEGRQDATGHNDLDNHSLHDLPVIFIPSAAAAMNII